MRHLRDQLLGAIRGDGHHPLPWLDRWLLAALIDEGASTATQLARSPRVQRGPDRPGEGRLTESDVRRWLRSARDRGLIQPLEHGIDGRLEQPEWIVSDSGRARLKEAGGLRARIGDRVAKLLGAGNRWVDALAALGEERAAGLRGPPPARREGMPAIVRHPGDALDDGEATERLRAAGIEHVVVLMMENRSFDHMLGYLELAGQDEVDGLATVVPNEYDGQLYEPTRLAATRMPKSLDPPHDSSPVEEQIAGGAMTGFVASFADATETDDPGLAMGYYTHEELPVYDFLAHEYCVCDRWFSSVPGATWPNRLYALAGRAVPGREGLFDDGFLFDVETFVRHLPDDEPATWRWYSTDPATLRLADGRYRPGLGDEGHDGIYHENFRRVERHSLDPGTEIKDGQLTIELGSGLLEDAAAGDLPSVAWIDPNFVDLSIFESTPNDDHPPSDVLAGQQLVLEVYRALASGPKWDRTLLVITYDEHGGFYDHVRPERPPESSPDPRWPTYGVRVPALVVSPWVDPHTVSHTVFDHTSLPRTILELFAPAGVARMPERVQKANHLGRLLRPAARDDRAPERLGEVADRLASARAREAERMSELSREELRAEPRIRGFPAEMMEGGRQLRARGLPAGHP